MHPKKKPRKSYTEVVCDKDGKPTGVKRSYIVSSQTAYHIRQLAMQNNTTEGRIVDKIIRTHLASAQIK